jgi:O-antigen/teichoic acid export membrane protein
MPEKITNIAKNTSYFTFALVLQKIISFTYFTLLARYLGPDDLGKYYFAISFTTIFAIFIDFGVANIITRETAKGSDRISLYIKNTLGIKIIFSIVTFLAVFIAINLLGYPDLVKRLVYLSSICMILDSFTLIFFSFIRGFHNLKYESIGSVIFQIIVMIFGLTVLYSGFSLEWQIGALVTASAFNVVYSGYTAKKYFKISFAPGIDFGILKQLFKITWPFAIFAILQRLYTYFDQVLLSKMAGDAAVGLYQVPFKIIFALQFLPLAFTASLYPAMSKYWAGNRDQLSITFERAMNYLIIIALPISIGSIVLSDKIILLFKSGFEGATLPLQFTMAAVLFIFIGFPIGSLLNACDKQSANTVNMFFTLILSVILNIILIPKYQAVGASITVLVSNIFMVGAGLYWVPKITKYSPKKILIIFLKSFGSAAIMAILILALKNYINIFILVALSGFAYFFSLFIFKGFRREDILSVYQSFSKK